MRDAGFAQQFLGGGYLVGFSGSAGVRQQQIGASIECMKQLRGLAIIEVIEAAPQGFSVQRDGALAAASGLQAGRVAAEDLLDRLGVETLKNVAHLIQCAPKARTTSGGRFHPESCRLIR